MYQSTASEVPTAPEEHGSIMGSSRSDMERSSYNRNQRAEEPEMPIPENILTSQAVGFQSGVLSNGLNIAAGTKALRLWLTTNELSRLRLEFGLELLWTAPLEPPITKSSLSELDIKRTINNPRLRHDLNFDREVAFRPNSDGSKGQQKLKQAKEYWEALSIEFAIYIGRKNRNRFTQSQIRSPWFLGPSCIPPIPWRLSLMFEALRQILKTLVPGPEWSAVDQRLDVDLLMQELDKDACDLIGLSEWLGELLRRSCSPMRDNSVLQMAHSIQEAVYTDDAHGLVCGLKNLFGVLETMKLDIANHQIRYLRLLMVDDNINFEQKHFLRGIRNGSLDVTQSLQWYDTVVQDNGRREVLITDFARAVVGIVSEMNPNFPLTFAFDFDRLRDLQVQFQKCMYQIICRAALARSLRYLRCTASAPLDACYGLLHRISNTGQIDRLNIQLSIQTGGNIALEIAREAYQLCGKRSLPDEDLVEEIKQWLLQVWDVKSKVYQSLDCNLCNVLDNLVDEELERMAQLSPIQILNRRATLQPHPESPKEVHGVRSIAQRIAHIIVLHWRVWGPIAYLQPRNTATASTTVTEQCSNVDQTTSRSLPNLAGLSENNPRDAALSPSCNHKKRMESAAFNNTRAQALSATQELSELTSTVMDICSSPNCERKSLSPLT